MVNEKQKKEVLDQVKDSDLAKPAILVSKRFYETVAGNGLGKTLHFEPINLEE